MTTVEDRTLSESELDALAAWAESRYVKGMLIREDSGFVRPVTMIEGYAMRRVRQRRCIKAKALIEQRGCCMEFGQRYNVQVDGTDHNDSPIQRRTVVYCGITNEPCPRARIEQLVDIFSILNSERFELCQPQ